MFTVEKRSPFSGQVHSMDIPLTKEEYYDGLAKHRSGALIQNAFPTLNADQREFILTGITPTEWAETFGEKEE